MTKRERIAELLDYGGNELFSTLMTERTKRSEGVERLIELLCIFSDRCFFVRGRSAAYRSVLFKAKERGYLGRGSNDLKSHRLTPDERQKIEQDVGDYISTGGALAALAKNVGLAVAIVSLVILAGYYIYHRLTSGGYQGFESYYSSQIVVEYKGKSGGELVFEIQTTDNVPLVIEMEHLPRIAALSSDGSESEVLLGKSITNDDPRSSFGKGYTKITISEKEYDTVFTPGQQYNAQFDFFTYNSEDKRIDIKNITAEFEV